MLRESNGKKQAANNHRPVFLSPFLFWGFKFDHLILNLPILVWTLS